MNKLIISILLFFINNVNFSQNNNTSDYATSNDALLENSLPADVNTRNVLENQLNSLELFEIPNISIPDFILNLLLAALLSFVLSYVYVNYGNSISNRKQFSRNFVVLSLTTMLIITVVKSSLALSLGLVGALSIIRFRSAIKEPEELTYLFLAISIGLGFGANQALITIIALVLILSIITIIKLFSSKYYDNQNLFLTILCLNPNVLSSKQIIDTVSNHCLNVNLRRIDETSDLIEISLSVELENFDDVNKLKLELQNFDNNIKFTLLDNKGIIG
tara:strand:- start:2182 stop:3009 length:828 start_codon:yes stop_codon:yes gene_type:complete